MSSPAPALSARRVTTVRLADAATSVTFLSAAYGLAIIFFPVSFPRILVLNWQNGRLTWGMIVLSVLLDLGLYLRVTYRLSAKPALAAGVCLGALPVLIVAEFSFLLSSAITNVLLTSLPDAQGRVTEEIVAHSYLTLIAAIFLPFLVLRVWQQSKTKAS